MCGVGGIDLLIANGASLVAQLVKNPSIMWETWVQSLSWEDPTEKEMATLSSVLARESHGQRSVAGYIPGGSQRGGYD